MIILEIVLLLFCIECTQTTIDTKNISYTRRKYELDMTKHKNTTDLLRPENIIDNNNNNRKKDDNILRLENELKVALNKEDEEDDEDEYDKSDIDDSSYHEMDYEEDNSELDLNFDSFGKNIEFPGTAAGKGGQGPGEALPIFLAEPQSTFVMRSRPATLTCKGVHALEVNIINLNLNIKSRAMYNQWRIL